MTDKIRLLFWMLWESRIPEFVRVMRSYFQYKHDRKIPLLQFIPIGWCYAKMGYEARLRMFMDPSPRGVAGTEAEAAGTGA